MDSKRTELSDGTEMSFIRNSEEGYDKSGIYATLLMTKNVQGAEKGHAVEFYGPDDIVNLIEFLSNDN